MRPGVKFGADFLLYKDGPVYYHASYSVLVQVCSLTTLNELTLLNKFTIGTSTLTRDIFLTFNSLNGEIKSIYLIDTALLGRSHHRGKNLEAVTNLL